MKIILTLNRNILNCLIIVTGILLIQSSSCQKDEDNPVNLTNGKTTAVFNPNKNYGTLTDIEGNIYKTIAIGSQTWMAENLRTTKYNDGTAIRLVTSWHDWGGSYKQSAYCNYNNTSYNDSIATFGRLYNGYAVFTGKLAPVGWHIPTDEEWTTLTNYLGTDTTACFKLQETGSTHWIYSHSSVTNESGFTALPAGYRFGMTGAFANLGNSCYFWTSTEHTGNVNVAWCRRWSYYNNNINYTWDYCGVKMDGHSVRCIKD